MWDDRDSTTILDKVREGLSEKVAFEQMPEQNWKHTSWVYLPYSGVGERGLSRKMDHLSKKALGKINEISQYIYEEGG